MVDRFQIRTATEADADFVAGLVSGLLEFGSPAWKDPKALAPEFADVLASAVRAAEPRSTVLIAQAADGKPLGFISLKVREDVTGVERGHVADLAVTEEARRMGVGRALMEAGENWARERGLPVISLDVWSTNDRAREFYNRLGYRSESLCLIKSLDPGADGAARPSGRSGSAAGGAVDQRRDGYEISTDRSRLDRRAIWAFLHTAYWWPDDATLETVEQTIDNSSLVFGLFDPAGTQAGFARVVTDGVRFAWLADVFVLEPHRGRGLGVWLIETVLQHPALRGTRIVLATADAHGLYERFGFRAVDGKRMMERPVPSDGHVA